MSKLIGSIKLIGGVILFAIAILTFYYQVIYENKTVLEIQTIDKTLLTTAPNIKGLSVQFKFNDSIVVKNLWRIRYLIKNIGDVNILGEGNNSLLLKSGIPLSFGHNCKIIKCSIVSENNSAKLYGSNIVFKQWRPKEYVELEVFLECKKNNPQIVISDRDIVNSEIIYTVFTPQMNKSEKKLIDRFPQKWINPMKWTSTIVFGFMLILGMFQIKTQFNAMPDKPTKVLFLILSLIFIISLIFPIFWMF